jgi:putative tryptophan/tyrosine transport system substrate-binding protein
MRRREFISFVATAATAWPLAARAQQTAKPVIGFLSYSSRGAAQQSIAGFRQGLQQANLVEDQGVAIEYRWADGQYNRLPDLAADLVRLKVAVILAGGSPAALAAKGATTTIPIVFTSGADPVAIGLVDSLNRPGGNVTGVYEFTNGLDAKRLGLLRELVPHAIEIGAIVNPNRPYAESELKDLQEAAAAVGWRLHTVNASNEGEIDAAFATISQQHVGALVLGADPMFISRREQIVTLAAGYSLPAIYFAREFAASGGLASYGPSLADAYRQAGVYTGQILKGAKPADLPVIQSAKFEFVINLRAAKKLGLTISNAAQLLADEVIE